MACKIIYKGISYDESDFKSQIERYVTINNLFNENKSLANAVYEALGFNKSTFDTNGITLSKETSIGWMFIQLNNKRIGRVKFVNNGEKGQLGLSIEINGEYQNKGYGQIVHILMADLAKKDYRSNLYSDYQNSSQEIQLLNSLVKKGYAEKIGDVGKASEKYPDSFVTEERAFRIKTSDEIRTVTPQQKQQAQQLYSQYLDTIFPDSKVKDIVYHGTTAEFEQFKPIKPNFDTLNSIEGIYNFSTNKEFVKRYGKRTIIAILNLKNPIKDTTSGEFIDDMDRPLSEALFKTGKQKSKNVLAPKYDESLKDTDGVINNITGEEYVAKHPISGREIGLPKQAIISVFEPEQIHILGGKQDIEGFKEFVNTEAVVEPVYKPIGEESNLQYQFKVVSNLYNNLDRVNKLWKQLGDTSTFWNKIQQDLQIPKDQINLLKESKGNTIEEKLASFAANYGYAVEINLSREGGNVGKNQGKAINEARAAGLKYGTKEFEDFVKNYLESRGEVYVEKPTQIYSNLTVPGGTNYTENEIATPAITPSIKGHAQFATDKGIGWFRSDDKMSQDRITKSHIKAAALQGIKLQEQDFVGSKTRRILEVQSDWGQKQRKSAEPDINIKYDIQQIINGLQKTGDLKIDCN